MATPSKHRALPPYPANTPPRAFPSPYHQMSTPLLHYSSPVIPPSTSSNFDGAADLSPIVLGGYINPTPHEQPFFNDAQKCGLNFQDSWQYQYDSSPSSQDRENYSGSSTPYETATPSSAATTPLSQRTQYHFTQPCYSTPTTIATYRSNNSHVNAPPSATGTPINSRQGEGGCYMGTPSTPPSPLYPHSSSPDLTTPTSEMARARYRNAIDTTPYYFPPLSPVMQSQRSEESESGSEPGGVPVGDAEDEKANEQVRRLMADQEGRSKFPGFLGQWTGFETAADGKSTVPGRDDEFISPRTNTHNFETQDTPLQAETPGPLASAFSPLTSPPLRRVYLNSNAYRFAVPPPGPLSPLPPAPTLPLPEPRYSENYSITDDETVERSYKLLQEHMKNRWSSVLSANNALQSITGTTGLSLSNKALHETTTMTSNHPQTAQPPPRPLMPGFSTPAQTIQRMQEERLGRIRPLRAIYEEYVLLPHAKTNNLCSLSIHAVSGSFGGGGTTTQQQPAKLQNELLAHFSTMEGATALQFLEIDIPNPTGVYNQHPFERWAFFVIALPMVCGPGGVDKGFVGDHEKACMIIAAPLMAVVVDGGKAVQDVLADGTACLRRDFAIGPGVAKRMEFWDKYGRWAGVGEQAVGVRGAEWLCAEVEGVPEGRMEEWGEEYGGVFEEGVRRDVQRWRRVREAMAGGVCRIVMRVVDHEGAARAERAKERRKVRDGEGEGAVGDWERDGVRVVEGGSSVKKRRRGR